MIRTLLFLSASLSVLKTTSSCGSLPANDELQTIRRFTSGNDNQLSAATTISGYSDNGVVGRWAKAQQSACPYLRPIRGLTGPGGFHLYVMDDALYNQRRNEGYSDMGTVGYGVTGVGVCNASVPIYQFRKAGATFVHQVTQSQLSTYLPQRNGWIWEGISFAIFAA
ncbi:Protein YIM1 [Trichinella spiralis]|uniref:Protein YIM1 n=1 Tax=Trichinella spiralis TaxID=6334 RepID=A0ABR3KX96_TRISP